MKAPVAGYISACCLSVIEGLLDDERPGWADDDGLVKIARALSEGFTGEKPSTTPAASDEVAHAYLAYFAPRTVAAVSSALANVDVPSRIVDVGAGTGAASLAFAAAGTEDILLLDHDPRALARARVLLERLPGRRAVKTLVADANAPAALALDDASIVSAFTLGELRPEADASEVLDLLLTLSEGAPRLFLVDAGDRRRARRLQGVRDTVIARGWHVRAPCPHEEPCPALERRRDWCHLRAPRALTPRLERFAAAVGRDPMALAYSFVDLVRAPVKRDEGQVLVIGEPRKEKGRARLPVCGDGGLRFVQVLKRDRAAHDALLAAERGAVMHDTGWPRRADTAHVDDVSAFEAASVEKRATDPGPALQEDASDAKLPP